MVVLPGTLAQTAMIERGILRFERNQAIIEAPAEPSGAGPKTITEEMFMETLSKWRQAMPKAVQDFLDLIEPLGVAPEYLASLPQGGAALQRAGRPTSDASPRTREMSRCSSIRLSISSQSPPVKRSSNTRVTSPRGMLRARLSTRWTH